jgi:GTP-binding protein
MRREGFEFQVSRPEVIFHTNEEGDRLEPFEELHIETSPETMGTVVEMLGQRRGRMTNMRDHGHGTIHLTYIVPTRGLLGFRHQFLTATRGEGTMHSIFHGYEEAHAFDINHRTRGSLIAWEAGVSNTYGLLNSETRGTLFIGPGVEVYGGMVVGEHQRPGDLEVNICKTKQLTNMRSANRDIDVRLTPPRDLSLDQCIEYLSDDELLEVTPESLRIRKRILDKNIRDREAKRAKLALA